MLLGLVALIDLVFGRSRGSGLRAESDEQIDIDIDELISRSAALEEQIVIVAPLAAARGWVDAISIQGRPLSALLAVGAVRSGSIENWSDGDHSPLLVFVEDLEQAREAVRDQRLRISMALVDLAGPATDALPQLSGPSAAPIPEPTGEVVPVPVVVAEAAEPTVLDRLATRKTLS